jgi:crotonobetainyl-CoA:carnitine CoA-transferase CaiB-like acyl-CoA transferase
MKSGPLNNIKVLAMENYIAGPYGSMIMGDLGAEVIKIEPPGGDLSRSFAGPNHEGEGFYYLAFNKNKKSIILDLKKDSNRKAFYDLVKISDVVWDNYRPGITERLRVDYPTLKQINQRIICCSITGYGQTGERSNELSYDLIGQALSGIMSITGEPGRPPVRCGPPIGDLTAGMMGVIGVLAAIVRKEQTGTGEKIETSLLDSCISLLAYYYSYYFCGGESPEPQGSGHLGVAPYGIFKTRDGKWISTGINWPRIAKVVGAEWIVESEKFETQEKRVKHKEELNDILQECILKADAHQWLELFKVEDIAAGLVQNIEEAVNDPQILHNDMILSLNHSLGDQVRLIGNPIKTFDLNQKGYSAPPRLGQHTRDILENLLGYSSQEIAEIEKTSGLNA